MTMPARPIGSVRATLAGEVRLEIERMIVDGDLPAGRKLNELELSQAMGVSRGTVREAIRSLADSGLIDLVTNRGAFVHVTSEEEVRNLYDLRGAIFGMACAAAARRSGSGEEKRLAARLERNMEAMVKAHASAETARYYALNIEFHDMLMEAAGNPKAKSVYDKLVREMHLYRRQGLSIVGNIAASIAEHRAIMDAVVAADPDAARQAALEHIRAGFARYMRLSSAEPAAPG